MSIRKGINRYENKRNLLFEHGDLERLLNRICVFLSHKNEDKRFVENVANYLIECGIDIYLDKNDVVLQSSLNNPQLVTQCIEEGINKSTHILCFVSEKTKESWWVPYEIGFGKCCKKPINTLLMKNITDIPDYLQITDKIETRQELEDFVKYLFKFAITPLNETYRYEIIYNLSSAKNTISYGILSEYLK